MTAPFDRWRASYRHRPGQLPTREKLDSLAPETLVTVRADILLQLVVQAENHEAPCGCLAASVGDEPTSSRDVGGFAKLPTSKGTLSGSGVAS